MSIETNRDIMRRHILELWGQGRTELGAELYAADIVDHMPFPGQAPGPEAMLQVVRDIHAALPDLTIELHHLIAEGDLVVDHWTLRATHTGALNGHPPTGNRVEFHGIDIARIRDGRIHEIWHVEELVKMFSQMGMPMPIS